MDLSITVNGMKFPNPFLLGSGPPGTNARVLAKSYDAGWGGAVAKTVSLESAKVVNVVPRYGKLRSRTTGEVIGFENIEYNEQIGKLSLIGAGMRSHPGVSATFFGSKSLPRNGATYRNPTT